MQVELKSSEKFTQSEKENEQLTKIYVEHQRK